MNFSNYFTYNESKELSFCYPLNSFVTFMGSGKEKLLKNLLFYNNHEYITLMFSKITSKNINKYKKNVAFVLNKHLNIFVGETVSDEIAFGMESLGKKKNEIENILEHYAKLFNISHLLNKDPNCLGCSDKVKIKIVSALVCEPKVLMLDEVLCELDYVDRLVVLKNLSDFVNNENVIFNFTNNVNECLYGNEVVILDDTKILLSGKTINVLNEDKLMKKLGFGLPFIVEVNKYLMDYGIVHDYYLDLESLVDNIWK